MRDWKRMRCSWEEVRRSRSEEDMVEIISVAASGTARVGQFKMWGRVCSRVRTMVDLPPWGPPVRRM